MTKFMTKNVTKTVFQPKISLVNQSIKSTGTSYNQRHSGTFYGKKFIGVTRFELATS